MSEQIEAFKAAVTNVGIEHLKVFAAPLLGVILELDERLSALEGQLGKGAKHSHKD